MKTTYIIEVETSDTPLKSIIVNYPDEDVDVTFEVHNNIHDAMKDALQNALTEERIQEEVMEIYRDFSDQKYPEGLSLKDTGFKLIVRKVE